jgi:hypothetical protein
VSALLRLRCPSLAMLALSACGGAAPAPLDTSCPRGGSSPEVVFAELAERGIRGPPDTLRLRLGNEEIVVGWKNLLSGRQLTLSCAYRRHRDQWRLLRARLDEGTHTLGVTARAEPPALIYRNAAGRLLEVVAVSPYPRTGEHHDE